MSSLSVVEREETMEDLTRSGGRSWLFSDKCFDRKKSSDPNLIVVNCPCVVRRSVFEIALRSKILITWC